MSRNLIESSLASLYQVSKSRFVEMFGKSRFVEMFGLPGLSHNSWKMRMVKSFCEVNPSKKSLGIIDDDLYVSFIPMAAVSDSGEISKKEVKKYSEVKKGFSPFRNNDVLFAKITPCMENGKGAVVSGLCNNIGFGSTEFHVLRANSDICNPYWLYYLIHLKNFRYKARMNMTGSAGQKRVPASFLENFMVSLPPKSLQDEYVSFAKHLDKLKKTPRQIKI